MSKIDELKKNDPVVNNVEVVVEKTPLALFVEELDGLDDTENNIFEGICNVLLNQLFLEDYEAFSVDRVEPCVAIITHAKHKKIRFDDRGVVVKLRSPLLNSKKELIADEIIFEYEPNEGLQRSNLANIKTKKDGILKALEESNAMISASLRVFKNGDASLPVSALSFSKMNQRDRDIVGTLFNFFR